MLTLTRTALLAAILMALPACEGFKQEQTTDVNLIIPKLMKPYNTPEEAATQLFNTTSADERRDAIAYLSTQPYGKEPPYIKAYIFLSTDPEAMVRAQAMRALGGGPATEVVPVLIGRGKKESGLKDKDATVRANAAEALYYSFSEDAIDPLLDRLKNDPSMQVRAIAARALVRSGAPRVIKGLIDALDDKEAVVVLDAHGTLQHLTGQYLDSEPRHWQEWYQNQPWARTAATEPATQGG